MKERADERPDYGVREEPVFGAFFACDHCEGYGAVKVPVTQGRWDMEPADDEKPCPTCLGFGTVYVEEGC